jgi:hypothetical protein
MSERKRSSALHFTYKRERMAEHANNTVEGEGQSSGG